jgi:putative membrane protein
MKNLIYPFFGVIILLSVLGCKDKRGKNYNSTALVDTAGVSFIHNGIKSGLTAIKASGLAITNSNNQKVIGLAKVMIEEHTTVGDELRKIAKDKQVIENDTIDDPHLELISKLSKKTGKSFDKAYLQMMITDHEQALKLFTGATQNNDFDIKNFASKTLPIIKVHLDSANAILPTLK